MIPKSLFYNYQNYYNKHGFVLIKDFFTNHEVYKIKQYANDIFNWNNQTKRKWMNYYERNSNNDKKVKARVENMINYHLGLKNLVYNRVNPAVNMITNQNMIIFKDKINWKAPNGQGFNAHQDQPAWSDFPPNKFVTAAFFANETTPENGCLEFAEDCNQLGLLDYETHSTGALSDKVEESLNWKSVPSKCNDILLFDSYAPHRSGPNITKFPRSIFFITYNDINDGIFYEDYFTRKRIELPPDNEREVGKEYKLQGSKYNLANPIV